MVQLFIIQTDFFTNVCPLLVSVFRCYSCLKLSKVIANKRFTVACRCWCDRVSLHENDQKFKFEGITGCGDS